jgi:hypothetical protein
MRCYLVTSSFHIPTTKVFCGTQAEVAAQKKAWLDEGAKRKDVSVSEVDVPDDKAGKIEYLNKCLKGEV